MVQISKAEKKNVYRYLINEGVIVIHKNFSNDLHKGTDVPNLYVWDRGFVNLVFSWQYYYYTLTNDGKKFLAQELGLTDEVVPLTWKKDQKRQYIHYEDDAGRGKKVRRDREDKPERGGRGAGRAGGRGGRNDRPKEQKDAPKQVTPVQQAQ